VNVEHGCVVTLGRHLQPPTAAEACGIIGVVGGTAPAVDYILEGLSILQNRGYDSAGMVTITEGRGLHVARFASGVTTSDALEKLRGASAAFRGDRHVGLGHTRWATHGAKTDNNAHPHLDATGRIAVVHNGVIENSEELKASRDVFSCLFASDSGNNHQAELAKEGFPCVSETDTEVIAQLVGFLVVRKGLALMEAVEQAQRRLKATVMLMFFLFLMFLAKGSWGIALLDKEHPEYLVAAAHGSPLLIGVAGDKKFIASEASAFAKYTRQYVALKDREVVKISVAGDMAVERHETYADTEEVITSPAPFPHWTIRHDICLF
jgi:glucosamine--fructose-6-phosphate aminotransferase (isomerizing)